MNEIENNSVESNGTTELQKKHKKRFPLLALIKIFILPISLAISGLIVQSILNSNSLRREYVALSIQILSSKDSDESLRRWAISLLSENSPVPIPKEMKNSLSDGVAFLPKKNSPFDTDENRDAQLSFSPDSAKTEKQLISVLNTSIRVLQERDSANIKNQQLISALITERNGILRKVFGSELFQTFKKVEVGINVSDEDKRSASDILDWSKFELQIK